MQARLQEALTQVLTEGGREVLGQPERFRNMLADALGDDLSSLRTEQALIVRLVASGGAGLVDGSLDRDDKLSLLASGLDEPRGGALDAFEHVVTDLGWIEPPADLETPDGAGSSTLIVGPLVDRAPIVLERKRRGRGRLVAAAAAAGAFVLLSGGGLAVQRDAASFESAAAVVETPAGEPASPDGVGPAAEPAADGTDTGPAQSSDQPATEEPHASPDPQVDPPASGPHVEGASYDGRSNSGVTHGDPHPRPVAHLSADTDLLTVGDYTTLSVSAEGASGYRWLDPSGQCTDSAPLCTVTCWTPFESVEIGVVAIGPGGESEASFVSIFCIDEPPMPPDFPPDFPPPPEPPY